MIRTSGVAGSAGARHCDVRADVAAMPHAKRKAPAPEPAKKKHGGGRPRNPPALGGVSAGTTARSHQSLTAALGLSPIRKTVVQPRGFTGGIAGDAAGTWHISTTKTPGVFENSWGI